MLFGGLLNFLRLNEEEMLERSEMAVLTWETGIH